MIVTEHLLEREEKRREEKRREDDVIEINLTL